MIQTGVLYGDPTRTTGLARPIALDEPLRVLAREVRTRWRREKERVLREHDVEQVLAAAIPHPTSPLSLIHISEPTRPY